jgi:cytochrome c oxidase subunit 2
MDTAFRLFPEQASTTAAAVDRLTIFLLVVTIFFTLLIFLCIVYLGLKYRRRSTTPEPTEMADPPPPRVETNKALELTWTVIPFIITLIIFGWASSVYIHVSRPPNDAMEMYVIGKQWMWKIQHPQGRREINELHVPLGRPVKLLMTSQDVIHSFFIPAFRIKQDVLPGRYTSEWFQATRIGEYHLFCAEYCGTQHSGMVGKIVVMEPAKYEEWLAGAPADDTPAVAGAKLFNSQRYACATCHGQKAPTLAGLYMRRQKMADGSEVVADEAYLRESILEPHAKTVAGYPPLMPSFQGQLSEEQVMQLIAYIKSLKDVARPESQPPATQPQ